MDVKSERFKVRADHRSYYVFDQVLQKEASEPTYVHKDAIQERNRLMTKYVRRVRGPIIRKVF